MIRLLSRPTRLRTPVKNGPQSKMEVVRERPDISLAEIAEGLAEKQAVSACPATVWYFFKRRGISFKKNRARRRARAA